jgi:HK97 family phage portal protein
VGRLRDFVTGRDLLHAGVGFPPERQESRSLAPTASRRESFDFAPISSTSLPPITQTAALRIADVYAACRVLADGVASLPPRVYRDTGSGRMPAGDDQRLLALLRRPSPGSTASDLFSTTMVHLLTSGNAFVGKFRHEGAITQLACLDPSAVAIEQEGGRIVYRYSQPEGGLIELGVADVVHVKAMSLDGLRGLSPVRQAMRALQLNQALADYLASWLGNDTRPGGVLTVTDGLGDLATTKRDAEELYGWQASPPGHGRIAVVTGEVGYTAVDPPLREQEFIAQRELSAREVARVMRVPAWAIDASTGDSLTYANVQQQGRFLLDHCLRPWLTRIEQSFNADADLCPGGTYLAFDTDALTRMDPDARATFYKAGIEGGWLTVEEIRAREDLPPLGGES